MPPNESVQVSFLAPFHLVQDSMIRALMPPLLCIDALQRRAE